MDKNFFHEKYALADYLFTSKMPKTQIAKEMEITMKELNEKLKFYGLDWIDSRAKKMSRGQAALVKILKKILPNEEIVFEHHLGERLFLDIYVPKYDFGIEYHGRQHFEWVSFFHETEAEFKEAMHRDMRKEELCAESGISLVVFRYNDELTEDIVYDRILATIRATPAQVTKKPEKKPLDPELQARVDERKAAAKAKRAKMRKELKAYREKDHEYQQRQREYRKQQKAYRKQRQRDDYYDNTGGDKLYIT